ncbi:hypothetical protein ACJMK2_040664 [Sinanodonta woodiana]|uniref:Uncharacterized protein n=1 Tax=Sinanodonta woodiana TaxID=1069815 RepID=A0ABD3W4Y0_SINWO
MARNEEKQFGRLNRLYLEKEKQEYLKKHPQRPKLNSLNSADEIKKWLPSIKTDIDFCLKQSQVACYPDTKIKEYSQKIESLSREYKAFLRKHKQLDPSGDVVPWTERAYSNKRNRWTEKTSQEDEQIPPSKRTKENETKSRELNNHNNVRTVSNTEGSVACATLNFNPIHTPILDNEKEYENCYGYNEIQPEVVYNANPDLMDRPLEFTCDKDRNQMHSHVNLVSCHGSLNLPYSDSSSDETEDHESR